MTLKSRHHALTVPLSAVGLLFAFLNIVVVLRQLPNAAAGDLFLASATFNQLFNAIVITLALNGLVPFLAGLDGSERAQFAWWATKRAIGLGVVVFVVAFTTAAWWVPVLFFGLGEAGARQLVDLLRIALCALPLHGLQHALVTRLRADGRAGRAEAAAAIGELLALPCSWLLVHYHGIQGAALTFVCRAALLVAALWIAAPLRRAETPAKAQRLELWRRVRPIVFGSFIYKSTIVVDKFAASLCPPGTIAALTVLQQVISAFEQVLARAVVAPVARDTAAAMAALPVTTRHLSMIGSARSSLGFLAVPIVLWFWCIASPSTFGAGAAMAGVQPAAVAALGPVMLLQPVLSTLNGLLNALFYAAGHATSPIVVGIVATLLGTVLKPALAVLVGSIGLAIAIVVPHLVVLGATIPLYRRLQRRLLADHQRRRAARLLPPGH